MRQAWMSVIVVAVSAATLSSALAADYPVPYRPAYRAPRAAYVPPPRPLGIPQAPPVYWVEDPPQYIQHLEPAGCGYCSSPRYVAVGEWRRTLPPPWWSSIYRDYGY